MQFYPNSIFHVYNRGNNRQKIFFARRNYLYFLKKVRKELSGFCDILAYCLMPNHFHFLIHTFPIHRMTASHPMNDVTHPMNNVTHPMNDVTHPMNENKHALNTAFGVLLRSYARAINNQEKRTGSLFQAKTRAKCLTQTNENYPLICFNYIHQNPMAAKLVGKMEDWEFSSFRDYAGLRGGTLCKQKLAHELLGLPSEHREFYELSYDLIPEAQVKGLFV